MINLGIMVCLTKVREKVVFNFTLKWFHVIIILIKNFGNMKLFLIEDKGLEVAVSDHLINIARYLIT